MAGLALKPSSQRPCYAATLSIALSVLRLPPCRPSGSRPFCGQNYFISLSHMQGIAPETLQVTVSLISKKKFCEMEE